MKKKILFSWIKLIGFLITALLIVIFSKSSAVLFFVAAVVALSLISWILSMFAAKRILLSFEVPTACAKKRDAVVRLKVLNESRLPAGRLMCTVSAQNCLSGENSEMYLEAALPGKGESSASFTVDSKHCGYIAVTVKKAYVTDWLGLLPVRLKSGAKGEFTVLPDTFAPQIDISIPPVTPQDEDSYFPDKKGYDWSEVFALREYDEGDSLKQIHWKLSGKLDKLIVRDGSLPVAKSILVFWDKHARDVSPEEADAMAEVFCSLCQALCDMGIKYTLGYSQQQGCALEEIESADSFLDIIPSMLKEGCEGTVLSGVQRYVESFGRALYGKVICLCAQVPDGVEEFASSNLTLISFGGEEASDAPLISVTAENYEEELEAVEL